MEVILKCPECGEIDVFIMPEEIVGYERFEARHMEECSDIILSSQLFPNEDLEGNPIEPLSPDEVGRLLQQERAYESREWD